MGFEENELNRRLDYVFASKNFKVISSEIISTDFSDHLPILVELEIE
jgi:endonuclease/exonuclease/phosphatase family metal-dependent hydrolase